METTGTFRVSEKTINGVSLSLKFSKDHQTKHYGKIEYDEDSTFSNFKSSLLLANKLFIKKEFDIKVHNQVVSLDSSHN
jgi:hypothetical protein